MELNWNFQRGGEVLRKIPSVGEDYRHFLELHDTVELRLSGLVGTPPKSPDKLMTNKLFIKINQNLIVKQHFYKLF